ncbi:MAG: aldose 1-epimerase family protein [Clostridium sp.]|nr:aldose 1-epimerase family protein [Bacteroides sp.]MCM1197308.1 aldose 1-epimerase family protein [Clostridium sp.]
METISNSIIEISVAEHGAELQGIRKDGREYLWQGDPRFWGRRSPVLFPIVGRVYDDVYRYRGTEYHLGQHGFARDMDFVLEEKGDDRLVYSLESSEETMKLYPCRFMLQIGYRLDGNSVVVTWRVENRDRERMHFQIGAHPAFYFPDQDLSSDERGYFSFDNPDRLEYISPAGKGCVGGDVFVLERDGNGMMPVDVRTFDCDTYMFEGSQLKKVTLHDRAGNPYVSVEFDAPLVALWSPTAKYPDCPFVCIEPWYGRCDRYGYDGDFADREYMQTLEPGAVFEAAYRIVIE